MEYTSFKEKPILAGQVALVTGGAVRIGAEICRALNQAGAAVFIHYQKSREAAIRLAKEIEEKGGHADVVKGALDAEPGCCRVLREVYRKSGRLDILVNNAAVFHKDPFQRISEKNLLREFRTNLFAPLWLTREFARVAQRGVVINLLDRRIEGWDVSCIPYVLTKKALAEATRAAALALAPAIRVNAVAPGPVLPPPGHGRAYLRDKAGPIPLKREITPHDVAMAVVFLAGAEAITGQILFVDGGQGLLSDIRWNTREA